MAARSHLMADFGRSISLPHPKLVKCGRQFRRDTGGRDLSSAISTATRASVVRKPKSWTLAVDRRALGARTPRRPQAREGKQRPIVVEREPDRRLARLRIGVFAERSRGRHAAVSRAERSAPVRARHVADVGDRVPAIWNGPGMHHQAMTSSCSLSSPVRTIGAIWSGKIPATAGGCPCGHALRETTCGSPLGLWSGCRCRT